MATTRVGDDRFDHGVRSGMPARTQAQACRRRHARHRHIQDQQRKAGRPGSDRCRSNSRNPFGGVQPFRSMPSRHPDLAALVIPANASRSAPPDTIAMSLSSSTTTAFVGNLRTVASRRRQGVIRSHTTNDLHGHLMLGRIGRTGTGVTPSEILKITPKLSPRRWEFRRRQKDCPHQIRRYR